MQIPLTIIEGICRLRLLRRPQFLSKVVSECPSSEEITRGLVFVEKRGGYSKWAHLVCPRCGDHVQLPLAGQERWSVKVDFLGRPTIQPSIWEESSCGAHFFVRKGELLWCG